MRKIKKRHGTGDNIRKTAITSGENAIFGAGTVAIKDIEANAIVGRGASAKGDHLEMKHHTNKNKEIITVKQNPSTVSQLKYDFFLDKFFERSSRVLIVGCGGGFRAKCIQMQLI